MLRINILKLQIFKAFKSCLILKEAIWGFSQLLKTCLTVCTYYLPPLFSTLK